VTLQVDTRTGSAPYIEPLRAAGLPVEPAVLDAGDVAILGRGPGGAPTRVGIEIKQWDDVLMCVRSGRFADQLRRMRDLYEVRWLLIEGRCLPDKKGFCYCGAQDIEILSPSTSHLCSECNTIHFIPATYKIPTGKPHRITTWRSE
jgi:hypothetical protein